MEGSASAARALSRRRLLGAGGGAAAAGAVGPAALVGCATGAQGSGRTGGEAVPTAGTPRAGAVVSVANSAPADQQAIYEKALRSFEARHPGVKVEYVSTQGQNHLEKVAAAFAAGTPYDVIRMDPNDTPTFAENKQIRAIDDLVKRDKYDLTDFFEKCLNQYVWKGKTYALPRGFGNQDIFYNTTLFESAGMQKPSYDWNARTWTTDEFLEAAQRASRLTSAGGEVWGWSQGTGLRQWAPWVWIFGGDILNKDSTACILDQPPAIDGLQFLQDLIHKHRVMPNPKDNLNAMQLFQNSRLAMNLGSPSAVINYRRMQGLSWDVAPMPRKVTRLTSGGGVAFTLAAPTKFLNEAWEVHKLVVSPEVQIDECATGTTAPPRKSVIKHPCFVDRTLPPKGIDAFLQAPEFVHPDPQALGWSKMEEAINAGLASLWDASKTARQVAQEVTPQVNRLIKENAR